VYHDKSVRSAVEYGLVGMLKAFISWFVLFILSLIRLTSLNTYGVVFGLKLNLVCSMLGAGEIDLFGMVWEASWMRTISP